MENSTATETQKELTKKEIHYNEKLKCSTMAAYGCFRLPISGFDLAVRPARTSVYIEGLNHSILSHAMTVALCKSVDFLLGFVVGTTSDNTSTKWGRRKPWVVGAFPLGVIAMFLLMVPFPFTGSILTTDASAVPCGELQGLSGTSDTSCPALAACLELMISNGTLPAYNVSTTATTVRPDAGGGLSAWFAVTYFFFYFFSWTCTMIPYDALGMELTSDYKSRVSLFSTKVRLHTPPHHTYPSAHTPLSLTPTSTSHAQILFQFIGYMVPSGVAIVLASVFPTDIIAITAIQGIVLAVLSVIMYGILLACVGERPSAKTGEGNNVPPVVALRRALSNWPYMVYLMVKFPVSLVALLPVNLLSYFMRYGMKYENWIGEYNFIQIIVLMASIFLVPVIWWATRRFGKRNVLLFCNAGLTPICLIYLFIPPESLPIMLLYLFGAVMATAFVIGFVVMDSMLADIIDYDTLHTGKRAEAVYTIAETNLQQFMEIIGGVLPLLLMNAVGFENNGGCSCGCGVKCDSNYMRWNCPGDIGYACSDSFDAPPLYGDTRIAPCLNQPTDGVVWVMRILQFGVTGVLVGLSAIAAYFYPISAKKHEEILAATAQLVNGEEGVKDPLTGKVIERPKEDANSLRLEHFNKSELTAHAKSPSSLTARLSIRLVVWIVVLVLLFIAMLATSGEARQNVVTLGAICCAGVFVLVPYDAVRLKVAMFLQKSSGEMQA